MELTNVNMLSARQLRIIYFFQIFKERFIGKSQYRNHSGLNMGSCNFTYYTPFNFINDQPITANSKPC